jgi:hypothetical protein
MGTIDAASFGLPKDWGEGTMPRCLSFALVALVGVVATVPALGDEPVRTFVRNVARDFRRNNCWYDNFVPDDRAAQRAPFAMMVSNGWRLQNTLDDYYFLQDTAVLTEAGQIKVQQIVLYTSPGYRAIFVHRTTDPQMTAERIQNVQQAAAKFAPEGEIPVVVETYFRPRGMPAEYINDIYSRYRNTTPNPRYQSASGSSGGSSGGSSSGGSSGSSGSSGSGSGN